ncbi:MAG: Vi polysaccharide biosynthesis UDP-N-acetylglucosamine C-6 dehydrogenase TviB, partial [Cyclobacteriaceae bacterium]|nr:Vi polysaccharide biosynthesis UDP-N-acetylglucosamine C-6 dehydrogenase TviB [Cyclobacteriaceae bacterium]
EVILSGRRINDNMGTYIASRVIKLMAQHDQPIKGGKALILGLTFKENCPDIRNSKVVDVIHELQSYGVEVDVYDPHADPLEVMHEYRLKLLSALDRSYHAIVLAVSHNEFKNLPWEKISKEQTIVFDVKGFLDKSLVTARL